MLVIEEIDRKIVNCLSKIAIPFLRFSLGLIFFWFGILKFFPGASSAEDLAARTISILTAGSIPATVSLPILAFWEVLIGLGIIFKFALRAVLLLLIMQMFGTLTPLFLFPSETFVHVPFVPTLEGQYIIKNLVLISSALVIGATVRGGDLKPN